MLAIKWLHTLARVPYAPTHMSSIASAAASRAASLVTEKQTGFLRAKLEEITANSVLNSNELVFQLTLNRTAAANDDFVSAVLRLNEHFENTPTLAGLANETNRNSLKTQKQQQQQQQQTTTVRPIQLHLLESIV